MINSDWIKFSYRYPMYFFYVGGEMWNCACKKEDVYKCIHALISIED